MASKRVIALAYADDDIDEDEFLVLMKLARMTETSLVRHGLDLENMSAEECSKNFRFDEPELEKLCKALRFPDYFIADNQCRMGGFDAMCLLLRRLAYPSRLHDLEVMFGKDLTVLSRFFNMALDICAFVHVHDTFAYLLDTLDQEWISDVELRKWAAGVERKGSPFNRCVAFIDGTNIEICRPKDYVVQKVCYSGYIREHDLKYSGVMAACGIFINFFGPIPGGFHDAKILYLSFLQENMAGSIVWTPTIGTAFHLYGDQAYETTPHLISPFRDHINEVQNLCNKTMSSLRITVEWGFGKISQLFPFTEFAKNQKRFLQPVGKYYHVAVLVTNCHTCLYGSIVSDYFRVEPPTLVTYLS